MFAIWDRLGSLQDGYSSYGCCYGSQTWRLEFGYWQQFFWPPFIYVTLVWQTDALETCEPSSICCPYRFLQAESFSGSTCLLFSILLNEGVLDGFNKCFYFDFCPLVEFLSMLFVFILFLFFLLSQRFFIFQIFNSYSSSLELPNSPSNPNFLF